MRLSAFKLSASGCQGDVTLAHTALQAPSRLRQMRSFAFKLSASGWQGDVTLASQVMSYLNMAVCASRLLCLSLRVPRLQRVIRCRQAAWSESRPGRALRLPCSVLVPPSLCRLPVISRDVPELRTSKEIRLQLPADQLRYHWSRHADTIQGDLRRRLMVLCATHHHPRYNVTCMAQMPGRYCGLSAVSKLRASSASLNSRTDLLSSFSAYRVAAEILSPSFKVPTNEVCVAEVSTTMWVAEVPAAMALFWGAPCYLGATTSTSRK
jgi:hypothetical protein